MTLGGPKRFLLKNCEKKFHISGVARKLENVSIIKMSLFTVCPESQPCSHKSELLLQESDVLSGYERRGVLESGPIRDQYSGHVTSIDQWEHSICVT